MALPFTLKTIFKAKEELRKLKYFTMQKYPKDPLKQNQNPITNLKFQHKPKYHLSKIPSYKNRPIMYPQGQNPLSYYTLQ
jgi:hypothetical protein